jgi:hypothetical protein
MRVASTIRFPFGTHSIAYGLVVMDLVTNVAAGAQAAGAKSKVVGGKQRVRRQILSSQANRI